MSGADVLVVGRPTGHEPGGARIVSPAGWEKHLAGGTVLLVLQSDAIRTVPIGQVAEVVERHPALQVALCVADAAGMKDAVPWIRAGFTTVLSPTELTDAVKNSLAESRRTLPKVHPRQILGFEPSPGSLLELAIAGLLDQGPAASVEQWREKSGLSRKRFVDICLNAASMHPSEIRATYHRILIEILRGEGWTLDEIAGLLERHDGSGVWRFYRRLMGRNPPPRGRDAAT